MSGRHGRADGLTAAVLEYKESSYCGNGGCVQVAPLPDGGVAVRDSKDERRPPHTYTAAEWRAFIAGAKDGEFDYPQV